MKIQKKRKERKTYNNYGIQYLLDYGSNYYPDYGIHFWCAQCATPFPLVVGVVPLAEGPFRIRSVVVGGGVRWWCWWCFSIPDATERGLKRHLA